MKPKNIYRNFWRRSGAFFLDCGVMMVLIMVAKGLVNKLLFYIFDIPYIPNYLPGSPEEQPLMIFLFFPLFVFVPFAYEFILTKTNQGTLGKRLFQLRVRDGEGNAPSWGRSALRAFAKTLHMILGVLVALYLFDYSLTFIREVPAWPAISGNINAQGGLGLMFVLGMMLFLGMVLLTIFGFWICLFTPKRQALHDLIAGTYVVRK